MLHKRLVSALEKIGATVEDWTHHSANKQFRATLDGEQIDWYVSKNWNKKLGAYDDQLYVGYVTKRSPHTDSMTDCFCDCYRDTIKAAVALLERKGY